MFPEEARKLFCAILVLCISTGVTALPTSNICELGYAVERVSVFDNSEQLVDGFGRFDSVLNVFGDELLQTSVSIAKFSLPSAFSTSVRALPADPAALILVVTGFLCITMVKDRRIWRAVFGAVLHIGQVGITAVPQLIMRHHGKKHIKEIYSSKITCTIELDSSFRRRAEVDGTEFIGLLNYLEGIPGSKTGLECCLHSKYNGSCQQNKAKAKHPFSLTESLLLSIHTSNCSGQIIEQFVVFFPAFIFDNLSRGPPAFS